MRLLAILVTVLGLSYSLTAYACPNNGKPVPGSGAPDEGGHGRNSSNFGH